MFGLLAHRPAVRRELAQGGQEALVERQARGILLGDQGAEQHRLGQRVNPGDGAEAASGGLLPLHIVADALGQPFHLADLVGWLGVLALKVKRQGDLKGQRLNADARVAAPWHITNLGHASAQNGPIFARVSQLEREALGEEADQLARQFL